MNIDLYLKKLSVARKEPTLDYLNEIIVSHQNLISFNNFAVYFNPGVILDLELEPLFDKVIAREEGGYCFENNKVFFYLLQGLGFKVEPKMARVLYNIPRDVPRTHRTTIVTIEGKRYLTDVGFGKDVAPEAIALESSGKNFGHKIDHKDGLFHLNLFKNSEDFILYTFDDGHYQESDFNVSNYYTNTHPDSKFVKELIAVKKVGNSTIIINGKKFSEITETGRTDVEMRSQQDFDLYTKKFNMQKSYEFKSIKDPISGVRI